MSESHAYDEGYGQGGEEALMAGKPRMIGGIEPSGISFALLYALSQQPLSKREMWRLTGFSKDAIARAVQRLEAQNVVVKQFDGRYRMVVTLVLPQMPHHGTPQLKPSTVEAMGPRPLRRPDPEDPVAKAEKMPKIAPPEHPKASERARELAKRINVPAVSSLGELGTGALAKCMCGAATPFKYGVTAVCPKCARK